MGPGTESEHPLGMSASSWGVDEATYGRLRGALVDVADEAVTTIIEEVPSYRGPFTGQKGQRIREAVQLALDVFLRLTFRGGTASEASAWMARASADAYDLGRGEARSGRTMEALLGAYRIGARVAWRVLSREAVGGGMPSAQVGQFAEKVFAYVDELSAASISGHHDELEQHRGIAERLRERLARALAAGMSEDELRERASRAGWDPPATLTAVLLRADRAAGVGLRLDARTLQVTGDVPGLDDDTTLLLVPDVGPGRDALRDHLAGRPAVLGPSRPWHLASSSIARAARAFAWSDRPGVLDTDDHLVELVLLADPSAYDDLRATVLAPLDGERPAARARLEETLRAWLLHRGRRELVAAALFVHPQTVRYRIGQLRTLFGETLDDPAATLALTLALGVPRGSMGDDAGR